MRHAVGGEGAHDRFADALGEESGELGRFVIDECHGAIPPRDCFDQGTQSLPLCFEFHAQERLSARRTHETASYKDKR
ncbi:hypothetical protein GCM10009851_10180 [Herbiconiux moechotypicola]|uniref:Uncharacterized protein n=1 Tax=Herbiconiux moechotypicola TaxID=637393 RepID=A0ABN3DDA8_9MICO